ncbi:MAG: hypothetical protein CMP22_02365 [Rickettsiales bacterium]|nr:hypothetical protein [Rickettsiales bacterium]
MLKSTILSNGLEVVSEYLPDAPSVTIGLWNNVGACHEQEHEHGLAHLLEHMLFKGTKKRSALDIAQTVDNMGAYMNAYTSKENTSYYLRCLSEDSFQCLDILADIIQNSEFSDIELEKEKKVIEQEIALYLDTPEDLVDDDLYEVAFGQNSMGRTILGTQHSLQSFDKKSLNNFIKYQYTTKNVKLVLVGNIDHDELCKRTEALFDLNKGEINPKPKIDLSRDKVFRDKDLEQAHIQIGFEGCSYLDPDYYVGQLYNILLGHGDSSYLNQLIREEHGLAYTVYSYHSGYNDTGLINLYAGTSPEDAYQCYKLMCNSVIEMPKTLKEDDLNKAKKQLKASLLMGLEKSFNRADHWGCQLTQYGKTFDLQTTLDHINRVTFDELQDFSQKLSSKDHALAVVGPKQDIMIDAFNFNRVK